MHEAAQSTTYDVVVVGAGAAGLQAAAHLLKQRPSLSVLILEKFSISGGRIRDVELSKGIEAAGIGAWRIDTDSKLVLDLLQRHNAPIEPWCPENRRFEARGVCVGSVSELRSSVYRSIPPESDLANLDPHMVPSFLQKTMEQYLKDHDTLTIPTQLGNMVRNSLGDEGEQFLSILSHGYKALADYDIDIMGTLGSANAGYQTFRPVGGMSVITNILEKDCRERGALFQHRALVRSVLRSNSCAEDGSPLYDVSYVTSRGRIWPGSDTSSATDYKEDADTFSVTARYIILAIPPSAISRIASQDVLSEYSILHNITSNPIFRSCYGIPAFRAAALYQHPWWDDNFPALPALGERGAFHTSTSRLSMIMPYSGRGPNGEAALHLSYCNDIHAKKDGGFWSNCVRDALNCIPDIDLHVDNDPYSQVFDKDVMYEHIREELAKAFTIRLEQVPDPILLKWYYWDDGAVHVQHPVDGVSGISRKQVEEWAVRGPLIKHGGMISSGDRIVLAGEGFSEKWGWVEGALCSANKAAQTVLSWMSD